MNYKSDAYVVGAGYIYEYEKKTEENAFLKLLHTLYLSLSTYNPVNVAIMDENVNAASDALAGCPI